MFCGMWFARMNGWDRSGVHACIHECVCICMILSNTYRPAVKGEFLPNLFLPDIFLFADY